MMRVYSLAMILCLCQISTACFGQVESDEARVESDEIRAFVAMLDASAATWNSELDIFSEFEFRGSKSIGFEKFEFSASGFLVRQRGVHRISVRFAKLANGVYPYRSFDLFTRRDLMYLRHYPAKVVRWEGLFTVPDGKKSVLVIGKPCLVKSPDRQSWANSAIFNTPHPFAFCGGDNHGVTFGGMRRSRTQVKRNSDAFNSGKLGSLKVEATAKGKSSTLVIKDHLPSGSLITREMKYTEFRGNPIKVREHYTNHKPSGELKTEMLTEVTSVVDMQDVGVVPLGLKVKSSFGDRIDLSEFVLVKSSIRKSKDQDFEVLLDTPDVQKVFGITEKKLDFRGLSDVSADE